MYRPFEIVERSICSASEDSGVTRSVRRQVDWQHGERSSQDLQVDSALKPTVISLKKIYLL